MKNNNSRYPAKKNPRPLIPKARTLRKQATPEEKILWRHLRNKSADGHRFRRQHPVDRYILDFVCLEEKLVIELDGGQHGENAEYDLERDAWLKNRGYRVLRFWNNEIRQNLDSVYEVIRQNLEELQKKR